MKMIAMLDTSEGLDVAEKEIGCAVEQLLTPLTKFKLKRKGARYAIDNGAFSKFDAQAFMGLLEREVATMDLCRFVAVPDVVGSALRTLEVFERWTQRLHPWPLALVAQDGQENLPIPWEQIDAVFIGGSTEWKLSKHASAIIKTGIALGKWVHVGRVNTPGRYEYFEKLGADSIDGSGLSRFSWMREAIAADQAAPRLFR